MKLLKYLFLLILIILIGAAAYIALLNDDFTIEKSAKLKAPQDLVFTQISNLKNWQNWSTAKNYSSYLNYAEKTDQHNSSLDWDISDLESFGKIENIALKHYSQVEQKAYLKKNIGKINYHIFWNLSKEEENTLITLKVKGKLDFWTKTLQLINQEDPVENLTHEIEKNIDFLKDYISEKMKVYSINIDGIKNEKEKTFIYTTLASKNNPELITTKRKIEFEKLLLFIEEQHLSADGPAFIIFNKIDKNQGNVIISFCQPIKITDDFKINEEENEVFIGKLENQKVIKSTLKGDYKNIPKLWEATKTYMIENRLKQDSTLQTYEVHKTTEEDSKNPADWITELYIPLQEKETEVFKAEDNWEL